MLIIKEDFGPLPEFGRRIQQGIMTLICIADGNIVPVGTGFVIAADGLMMTATHVVEEALKHAPQKVEGKSKLQLPEFYALYLTDQTHGENNEFTLGGFLPIQRVWFSEELDIAYCWLTSPLVNDEPLKYPIFRLSPGLPQVGENVVGFGYHKMKGSLGKVEDGKVVIDYKQDTAFTKGKILDVFPLKRDSAMLPFPCFHTNARFDHGMSGGPIMNSRGDVCGVVCSSFPQIEDNPEYISYGSLIWPALGTQIEVALSQNTQPEMISVYELIQKGFVATDETITTVKIDLNEKGERIVFCSS